MPISTRMSSRDTEEDKGDAAIAEMLYGVVKQLEQCRAISKETEGYPKGAADEREPKDVPPESSA
jgi:hypothetical protein